MSALPGLHPGRRAPRRAARQRTSGSRPERDQRRFNPLRSLPPPAGSSVPPGARSPRRARTMVVVAAGDASRRWGQTAHGLRRAEAAAGLTCLRRGQLVF